MLAEKRNDPGTYHCAVGVHGHDDSHSDHCLVYFAEVGAEHRFAAGKKQIYHTALYGFAAELYPLVRSKLFAGPGLLVAAHPDIAHLAVEVASRRQLKGAADRYPA